MKDLAKMLCIFVAGFALFVTTCDAILKQDRRPKAAIASEPRPRPEGKRKEPTPAERPETPAPTSEAARSCASFDPVAHPEQVLDIMEYASSESCKAYPEIGETVCTPVDAVDAVWRNETGMVYGSGRDDTCDMTSQLEIRCAVGHSCGHLDAMKTMGARFGWDLPHLKCSCGSATMSNDTHYFGGCCGPFQFSGAEIVDKALAMNLDPMTFCGGAVIAADELRDYYVRFRKEGSDAPNAWRLAVKRYFGADLEGRYWAHAKEHWEQFHAWYVQGHDVLHAKVAAEASYSLKFLQNVPPPTSPVVASE